MGSKNVTIDVLDTNVLIRFLLGDVRDQQKQAHAWFQEAQEKKRTILVFPVVIAETSFVLKKFYQKQPGEIADALETFVSQKWLKVQHRRELLDLWSWYRSGFHFVDSFLLAWSEVHHGAILSFDQKIMRQAK